MKKLRYSQVRVQGSAEMLNFTQMKNNENIKWLSDPGDKDYKAAVSYLGLIFSPAAVKTIVAKLRKATDAEFKAKDIFRASTLPLLPKNHHDLKKDLKKINAGEAFSPILLVRDTQHGKVIIADGYHRLCAVYYYNDEAMIRCRIV